MPKIVIGLSKPKSFSICSKVIQLFQHTEYSHTYIKFKSQEMNRELVYQASGLEVNFESLSIFNSSHIIVKEWEIEVNDEVYSQILGFCADEVGKPYGIKAIIGIFFYILFGWKLINSDKLETFICSELVGYILQMIGILGQDVDLDYFIPKDVFNTLNR